MIDFALNNSEKVAESQPGDTWWRALGRGAWNAVGRAGSKIYDGIGSVSKGVANAITYPSRYTQYIKDRADYENKKNSLGEAYTEDAPVAPAFRDKETEAGVDRVVNALRGADSWATSNILNPVAGAVGDVADAALTGYNGIGEGMLNLAGNATAAVAEPVASVLTYPTRYRKELEHNAQEAHKASLQGSAYTPEYIVEDPLHDANVKKFIDEYGPAPGTLGTKGSLMGFVDGLKGTSLGLWDGTARTGASLLDAAANVADYRDMQHRAAPYNRLVPWLRDYADSVREAPRTYINPEVLDDPMYQTAMQGLTSGEKLLLARGVGPVAGKAAGNAVSKVVGKVLQPFHKAWWSPKNLVGKAIQPWNKLWWGLMAADAAMSRETKDSLSPSAQKVVDALGVVAQNNPASVATKLVGGALEAEALENIGSNQSTKLLETVGENLTGDNSFMPSGTSPFGTYAGNITETADMALFKNNPYVLPAIYSYVSGLGQSEHDKKILAWLGKTHPRIASKVGEIERGVEKFKQSLDWANNQIDELAALPELNIFQRVDYNSLKNKDPRTMNPVDLGRLRYYQARETARLNRKAGVPFRDYASILPEDLMGYLEALGFDDSMINKLGNGLTNYEQYAETLGIGRGFIDQKYRPSEGGAGLADLIVDATLAREALGKQSVPVEHPEIERNVGLSYKDFKNDPAKYLETLRKYQEEQERILRK